MKEYSVGQIIKNMIVVLIVIVVFYFLTILLISNKETTTPTTTNEIQYDEIRISSIYLQSQEEYYVLVQLEADESSLSTDMTSFENGIDTKIYTAVLDSAYNKNYYGSEINLEGVLPIFSQTTLVKVQSGVIIDKYEGLTSIKNYINSIVGEDNE